MSKPKPDREPEEQLLTSGDLAKLLETDQRLLNIWADRGILPSIRQLGGQRRYRPSQVAQSYADRGAELPATFRRYLAGEEYVRAPVHLIRRIPVEQLREEIERREREQAARKSPRAETRGAA